MTRARGENGSTSTSRDRRLRFTAVVAVCVILLGAIAAWAVAARFPADGLGVAAKPTLVSNSQLMSADLSDRLLAAGVAERITAHQVASRKKGYLSAGELSAPQSAAVRKIARRHSLLDKEGKPTETGTNLRLGLWQIWECWVSTPGDGKAHWFNLGTLLRPPTAVAIAKPPLAKSRLRSSWPHRAPSAGLRRTLRLLNEAARQGTEPDAVGWRLSDLPLLYRNWVENEWQQTAEEKSGGGPPHLDPARTNVLWTRAILVSVVLLQPDGSGGGTEITVPTF